MLLIYSLSYYLILLVHLTNSASIGKLYTSTLSLLSSATSSASSSLSSSSLPPPSVSLLSSSLFPASQEIKNLTYVDVATLYQENNIKGPNFYGNSLPECATQQVCNALFVRLNHTRRLCDCSSNFNWECSNEPGVYDGHTIELTRIYDKKVYTQVKLCEPLVSVRTCKSPTDWTLLALQSERSGKAHYVVACKCPDWAKLEGPYTHSYPPYARIPGIKVYGMLCAQMKRLSKKGPIKTFTEVPEFPWDHAYAVLNATAYSNYWY